MNPQEIAEWRKLAQSAEGIDDPFFHEAVTPELLLSLIDELEDLKEENRILRTKLKTALSPFTDWIYEDG